MSGNFYETFVQRQIVTYRVLPTLSVVAIVWKVLNEREFILEIFHTVKFTPSLNVHTKSPIYYKTSLSVI